MFINFMSLLSKWSIPFLLLFIPLYGQIKGAKSYESFVEGAKEGIEAAVRILPFLIGMFVAIDVFRQSGAMLLLFNLAKPLTDRFNVPSEVLPLMLLRPLSGSGALGYLSSLLSSHGPDSLAGRIASTIQGSGDTTLYILTVYFGSVGIKKIRHALWVGLISDFVGFMAAVAICLFVFGVD